MRKGSRVKDVTRGADLGERCKIFHMPHSIYLTGSLGMVWEGPHFKREMNGEPLKRQAIAKLDAFGGKNDFLFLFFKDCK